MRVLSTRILTAPNSAAAAAALCALLLSGTVNAHDETPVQYQNRDSVHCNCISEARDRYDPFIDYRDSHMPTTGAEEGLIRWVYVENIYKNCMSSRGAVPVSNPFPYGVDDYPGGTRMNPAYCSS